MNDLTPRQMELLIAVTSRSSDIGEQLALLARTAPGPDVDAVRAVLLAPHVRACRDRR